ncbi:MAG TPA: CHAD domain-containing protein [Terriglobia bacterium]|nr:CHAD domain-containing protein [Terriglobia bacterium]
MTQTNALLPSVDKSWKQFSSAWKKARAKGSEKAVHDLRVSTRRLIATLELAGAISKGKEIAGVQKQFKKVLKRMGPLRDIQVQLENLSQIRAIDPINDFKRSLERRERREIGSITKDLKRRRMRRLSEGLRLVHAAYEKPPKPLDNATVRRSIDSLVAIRHRAFWRARSRFKPENQETLHSMRIALKKLRYVVEAAQPILGRWAGKRSREMHACQQLMGDTRDLDILKTRLEKWAHKKGRKVADAVTPELAQLGRKRQRLVTRIRKSSAHFEELIPVRKPKLKPAGEATQAIPLLEETSPVWVRTIH